MAISIIKRLLLAIPFVRHKMAKQSFSDAGQETVDICNRLLAMKLVPLLVESIKSGKIGLNVLASTKYCEDVLSQLFGEKAADFSSRLTIEQTRLLEYPNAEVWLLHTPSDKEIGQTELIAFVLNGKDVFSAYTLEFSSGSNYVVGEWDNGVHYNYGTVKNVAQFKRQIASLQGKTRKP